METKKLALDFLVRAKNYLTDIFAHSTATSFITPFLMGYYTYIGIALAIIAPASGGIIFTIFALPAILGLLVTFVEPLLAPRVEVFQ
jgi:hypothetical protein